MHDIHIMHTNINSLQIQQDQTILDLTSLKESTLSTLAATHSDRPNFAASATTKKINDKKTKRANWYWSCLFSFEEVSAPKTYCRTKVSKHNGQRSSGRSAGD